MNIYNYKTYSTNIVHGESIANLRVMLSITLLKNFLFVTLHNNKRLVWLPLNLQVKKWNAILKNEKTAVLFVIHKKRLISKGKKCSDSQSLPRNYQISTIWIGRNPNVRFSSFCLKKHIIPRTSLIKKRVFKTELFWFAWWVCKVYWVQ